MADKKQKSKKKHKSSSKQAALIVLSKQTDKAVEPNFLLTKFVNPRLNTAGLAQDRNLPWRQKLDKLTKVPDTNQDGYLI